MKPRAIPKPYRLRILERLAAKWCRRATEVLENPAGAHLLAEMYRDGELGRPDRRQALRWSCRAAAMGDPEALGEVGIAYHNGAGVAKDQRFAATLYRAAAAGGDAWATYLLGLCIRDGEGAPKSRPAARRWFRIALSRGIPEAGPELARLARTGKASRR